MAPTKVEMTINTIIIKGINLEINKINLRGPVFWKVINSSVLFHVKPSIIEGNQKWKGAAPNFNIKAQEINQIKGEEKVL